MPPPRAIGEITCPLGQIAERFHFKPDRIHQQCFAGQDECSTKGLARFGRAALLRLDGLMPCHDCLPSRGGRIIPRGAIAVDS